MKIENEKYQLKGLTLSELQLLFKGIGEPKYRGEQVFNWMYNHLSTDFNEMLNLSKHLREKLNKKFSVQSLNLVTIQDSPATGTKKYLFSTFDNHKIESVVIPDKNRNTLCISTQVGCPLDCKFCATGLMGYKRNLTAAEIVDQYLLASKDYGKKNITNIVYMGMGEPLLNFDTTLKTLSIFTSELNKGLSRNRITVSTAGIPEKIKVLADSGLRVKLALSLHSCFDDVRSQLMPINMKYPLEQNIEAIKHYSKTTKTPIVFEYTLFNNVNDRKEDINALIKLSNQLSCKINVIPFNSIAHMNPGGISATLEPTPMLKILNFVEKLREGNVTVMLRKTQGDDIAAACGQLAIQN